MINSIYERPLDYVYKLNYPNYLTNNDIDFVLNGWAGNENGPMIDRNDATAELNRQDMNDMYQGSSMALERGADKDTVLNAVNEYYPRYVTPNDSLEVMAVENLQNQGLLEDDITYNNMQDPDSDVYDTTDFLTRNLLYDEYNKAVDDSLELGGWKTAGFLGEAMLSGFTLDIPTVEQIKKVTPFINWGDAITWEDMKKVYNDEVDKQIEQGTFTPFIKDIQSATLGIENDYTRDAFRRMVMGSRMDDWANGFAVFGGAFNNIKSARAAAKIGGAKGIALNLAAHGDDASEAVSSFAKKAAGGDRLVNYSNSDVITDSLRQVVKDKEAMGIIDMYHNEALPIRSTQEVEEVIKNTFNANVNKSDYLDVTNIVQDGENIKATVLFGNGVDNQGAMTKKGVDNLAKDLGIKDYQAVRKDGAGYYLQTTISEKGLLDSADITKDFGVGVAKRVFGGSSIMPEWFHTELLAGYRKASKMEETLFKRYQKKARYLSTAEKDQLNELYLMGQRANNGRGAWMNANKLYEEGKITKNVRDAFNDFRIVNDIDYIIANASTRNKLLKAGYISDLEDDIVKPIKEGMLKTPNYSQMVIKNGNETITATTHSAQQVESLLKESGNVLVEVAPISVKGKALPYTHKIISPDKLTDKLKQTVLPYRAGGRRKYAYGTNFLKIGQTMQLNGEKVNAYSRIIGATNDAKKAKEVANELNRALEYVQRIAETGDTSEVAAELVRNPFKFINVSNTDDLKKLGDGLDYTQRVQVLKEGESMVYNNGLRTLYEDPLDYDTAFAEMALVQGDFYSKRGQILTDFLSKEAKLVDIQEMFDQVVKRASTNNALGSLYEGMGALFKNRYIELIDTNTIRNPRTLSGVDLLRYGKLKDFKNVPVEYHQALREAKNMQLIYKRLANVPTEIDNAINGMMRTASNLVAKTNVLNERQLAYLAKSDPFAWGRALLFQTTMGLFNLKQLWAQGMGAITMGLAHPVLFTRSMLATPFVLAGYLTKDSIIMRNIFKTASKGVGIGGKTFDDLMRYFDEYGTTMGTYRSPMTEIIKTTKYLDTAGKVLRWPVEWGTNYANVVNDIAAFLEAGGKNWKKIAARADDFAMNQTRATRSAFQAGQHLPTKTISQFTSWPHRVMESMLNKRLTKGERIGIMLGQVALWGAVATAVTDPRYQINFNAWLRENTQGLPEEWKNIFIDGVIKTWLKEEGLYADEGIGGAGLVDLVLKMSDTFGENDVTFEIPGGFKPVTRLAGALKTAMWVSGFNLYPGDEYTIYNVAKRIATDKDTPSGPRNASKFILGRVLEEAYTTNGKLIKTDVEPNESYGMLFGLQLSEQAQAQALYMIHNDMEKTIDDLYEDYVGRYLKGWNVGDAQSVKNERLIKIKEGISSLFSSAHKVGYGRDGDRYIMRKIRAGFRGAYTPQEIQNLKHLSTIPEDSKFKDVIKTYMGAE